MKPNDLIDIHDQKRPQAPAPPPVGDPDLSKLYRWFEQLDAVDADVTWYAIKIVEAYGAAIELEVGTKLKESTTWHGFALHLSLLLMPLIRDGKHDVWVRDLLKALVNFSLLNPSGSPENRLAELLQMFFGPPGTEESRRMEALLPTEAQPAIQLIYDWQEESRLRMEMSGY
jgi:hypothetical protein